MPRPVEGRRCWWCPCCEPRRSMNYVGKTGELWIKSVSPWNEGLTNWYRRVLQDAAHLEGHPSSANCASSHTEPVSMKMCATRMFSSSSSFWPSCA